MEAKLIKTHNKWWSLWDMENNCIANTINADGFPFKLSLKNCQAIERGYDLDELAIDEIPDSSSTTLQVQRMRFIHGFQKALELLGDKKFTYNQMVSAITESSISHRLPSLIIQDLQQSEWEVAIEMRPTSLVYKSNLVIEELDADGCLILKRK